jgi:hypothetical protein
MPSEDRCGEKLDVCTGMRKREGNSPASFGWSRRARIENTMGVQ